MKDKTWQVTLFEHLNEKLRLPLKNGAHRSDLFVEIVSDRLNEWKHEQQTMMKIKLGYIRKDYLNEIEEMAAEKKAKDRKEAKEDEKADKEKEQAEMKKRQLEFENEKEENAQYWRSYETTKWLNKH